MTDVPIVGVYRSHTRRGFSITAEDATLYSTYFRKPSDVFLLIKSNDDARPRSPASSSGKTAKFSSDTPYAQFALHVTMTGLTAPEISVPPLPKQPAMIEGPTGVALAESSILAVGVPDVPSQPTSITAAPISSTPLQPKKSPMPRWQAWLGLAGAVALGVILAVGIRARDSGSPSANGASPLALHITRSGDALRLSWDHRVAPPGQTGQLWIKGS